MEASGLSLFLACVALPVGSDGWERVVLSVFILGSDFPSAIHFNPTGAKRTKEM